MFRKYSLIFSLFMVALLVPGSALAQYDEYKIELIPFIGYTFSEGVPVEPVDTGSGTVNRLNPVSGMSYGFQVDMLASEHFAIGFNFSEQLSDLEGKFSGGGGKQIFTDMKVRNYHGIFTYNFGDADEKARPYLFGGIGATNYSPGDIESYDVDGSTRFSTTWGGGVKFYATDNVGLRFGARWTPTHINTSADGLWCSPWYPWGGCWVVGTANYSNQFEMSGGIVFRF